MGGIDKQYFGNTGHLSSRAIFGSFCLINATETIAEQTLELLLKHGVNHIDTAPAYGDAELQVGNWMKRHRKSFFLATKTDKRSCEDAREQFYRSLDRLQTDHVDLLQMHNLTDVVYREIAMGAGGTLDFLIDARKKGLAKYIGVTGHGVLAARMHLQSLQRFDFDSVLLPYNYPMMKLPRYRDDFNELHSYCRQHNVAVQTIKSAARCLWREKRHSHSTWYEPLDDEEAVVKAVHWAMARSGVFLVTTGDLEVLPKFLAAVATFVKAPTDNQMDEMVKQQGMRPLFDQ